MEDLHQLNVRLKSKHVSSVARNVGTKNHGNLNRIQDPLIVLMK